jgi:hypothetical protein
MKKSLNHKLIDHYQCFNTERFYLDVTDTDDKGYISVVTSSISDTCPYKLCKNIAKFIKKSIKKKNRENYHNIYVGAWFFEVSKL